MIEGSLPKKKSPDQKSRIFLGKIRNISLKKKKTFRIFSPSEREVFPCVLSCDCKSCSCKEGGLKHVKHYRVAANNLSCLKQRIEHPVYPDTGCLMAKDFTTLHKERPLFSAMESRPVAGCSHHHTSVLDPVGIAKPL